MSDHANLPTAGTHPAPAPGLLMRRPHSGFNSLGAFSAEEALVILRWRHAGSPPVGASGASHEFAAETLARRRRRARTMQRLRTVLGL